MVKKGKILFAVALVVMLVVSVAETAFASGHRGGHNPQPGHGRGVKSDE